MEHGSDPLYPYKALRASFQRQNSTPNVRKHVQRHSYVQNLPAGSIPMLFAGCLQHHVTKPFGYTISANRLATPCSRTARPHHVAESLGYTLSSNRSAAPYSRPFRPHENDTLRNPPPPPRPAQLSTTPPSNPSHLKKNKPPARYATSIAVKTVPVTHRPPHLSDSEPLSPSTLPSQLKDTSPALYATSIAVQARPVIGRLL